MKTMHRIIAGAATAAALTAGIGLAAPLVSAATTADIDACHLDKKVAELQSWDTNDKHNIMVWRERAQADSQFTGIVAQGEARARPCKEPFADKTMYHWVVFDGPGHFVRKGDGGFRNWAFSGKRTESGNRVTFQVR
ncbi:MAG: hypothetical protein ABIQ18_35750 [Umezawaea sp.]